MSQTERAIGLLALGCLVAVILAPPEAYGSGRMLLVLTSTFAYLALALEGTIPWRYLAGGCAGVGLLLGHSLLLSADLNRSIEMLGLLWAYYCLFGVFRFSPRDLRFRASLILVLLASTVSLYGLYQYFWGFANVAAFVEDSAASETARTSILNLLATERVFSTFALPGTLWGFLILTLPLHAILWQGARRWQRAVLVANGTLVIAVATLTQSYGFVLGLVVVLGGWMLTRPGLRVGRAVIGSALVIPVAGGIVGILYAARAGTHNPVWLRLQNWLSAWEMFTSNPLGSGINTYAVMYFQHQQPGANETQFAHNTPLQLMAELGVFGLLILTALGVYGLARLDSLRTLNGVRRWVLLSLLVWGVHNLMDINVYFGSVGAVGATLAGLFAWSPPKPENKTLPSSRRTLATTGVLASLVLVSSGIIYLSGEFLFRARTELELLEPHKAAASLETAARINPIDSSIFHEAGQTAFELYYATRETRYLDSAKTHFRRAIQLSPKKVGPRIGLALCLSTENRLEDAIRELEIAQALHPEGTQASNIRRMLERQLTGGNTQETSTP